MAGTSCSPCNPPKKPDPSSSECNLPATGSNYCGAALPAVKPAIETETLYLCQGKLYNDKKQFLGDARILSSGDPDQQRAALPGILASVGKDQKITGHNIEVRGTDGRLYNYDSNTFSWSGRHEATKIQIINGEPKGMTAVFDVSTKIVSDGRGGASRVANVFEVSYVDSTAERAKAGFKLTKDDAQRLTGDNATGQSIKMQYGGIDGTFTVTRVENSSGAKVAYLHSANGREARLTLSADGTKATWEYKVVTASNLCPAQGIYSDGGWVTDSRVVYSGQNAPAAVNPPVETPQRAETPPERKSSGETPRPQTPPVPKKDEKSGQEQTQDIKPAEATNPAGGGPAVGVNKAEALKSALNEFMSSTAKKSSLVIQRNGESWDISSNQIWGADKMKIIVSNDGGAPRLLINFNDETLSSGGLKFADVATHGWKTDGWIMNQENKIALNSIIERLRSLETTSTEQTESNKPVPEIVTPAPATDLAGGAERTTTKVDGLSFGNPAKDSALKTLLTYTAREIDPQIGAFMVQGKGAPYWVKISGGNIEISEGHRGGFKPLNPGENYHSLTSVLKTLELIKGSTVVNGKLTNHDEVIRSIDQTRKDLAYREGLGFIEAQTVNGGTINSAYTFSRGSTCISLEFNPTLQANAAILLKQNEKSGAWEWHDRDQGRRVHGSDNFAAVEDSRYSIGTFTSAAFVNANRVLDELQRINGKYRLNEPVR